MIFSGFGGVLGTNVNKQRLEGGQAADATKVRNQKLPFMLESTDENGEVLDLYILPLNPEEYTITHAPRSNYTVTKDGVYEDHAGMAPAKIVMRGTLGFLGTLLPGNGVYNFGYANKDGFALYKDFETVFMAFYEQYGTYDRAGKLNKRLGEKKPVLKFYDYTNRDYFIVQVNSFRLTRNIQRRMLFQYDLQMTALSRVEPEFSEDVVAKAIANLSLAATDISAFTATMNAIAGAYAKANDVMNSVVGICQDISYRAHLVANSVIAFRAGLSNMINAPADMVDSITADCDRVIDMISAFPDVPHELTRSLRDIKRSMMDVGKERSLFVESSTGDADVVAVTAAQMSALEVAISDGETIQAIAAKQGADWQQIAVLNNLDAPYIGKTDTDRYSQTVFASETTVAIPEGATQIELPAGAPQLPIGAVLRTPETTVVVASHVGTTVTLQEPTKVEITAGTAYTAHEKVLNILLPGDKIQIPETVTSLQFTSGGTTFEEKLYGIDEWLNADGFMEATSTGDVAVVGGVDNLKMQIFHRIQTARGELAQLRHREYGSRIHEIIGKVGNAMWRERAIFEAELGVMADPRIEAIVSNDTIHEGTAITIDIKCRVAGKAAPEQITLPLG